MKLVDRVKNILLNPKQEWAVIASENTATKTLIINYILPLAGMAAVAGFIGSVLIGQSLPFMGSVRIPIGTGIGIGVFTLVMAVVGSFILSLVINALASSFGGEKNSQQAFKLAVYSYTPAWVAGLLGIIPSLGFLALFASLYGLYLLYLGLPSLMKSAAEKSGIYTIVVVISAIVLTAVINLSMALFSGMGMMMSPMSMPPQEVEFKQNPQLEKLEALGKKMTEVGNKMDAAEKSGNQQQQIQAAMEGLGAVLGGGKTVEPVALDQLKPLLPPTFAGLPQTKSRAEREGVMGIKIAKAEATYSADQQRVKLEISDLGGASGLLGLASWVNVEGEKQDDFGSEKTEKIDGRMVHEKSSKNGDNEYSIVVAERFMVKANGQGVDLNTLKQAAQALDIGKLESFATQ